MYQDVKWYYWWPNMKREIAGYVSRCLVYQQVKTPRQKIADLLQPLDAPEWKWESVAMDFITGFPRTAKGFSVIWVVIHRLTKVAHFIPGKPTYAGVGTPTYIWQNLLIIIAIRLPLVCHRLKLIMAEVAGLLFAEKIRARILAAQSRQISYADVSLKDVEFEAGEKVFLKVVPIKGFLRFGKKGKLSPRFIRPFEILERVGSVAYRLALPPSLSVVHNIFHVSMLRKYLIDPSHVVDFESLQLNENLSYEEKPA
ncbi:uncharacterized protein LOC120084141 [Benincasa hispida]|uniref:uncharacterized protein LOC120084141 n=1 Tax=Benincasa hispida TaxID=102211 RepID=UPI0018FF95D0|nr:uncharacterized protein LOC120084141 [Benincasa hispida]